MAANGFLRRATAVGLGAAIIVAMAGQPARAGGRGPMAETRRMETGRMETGRMETHRADTRRGRFMDRMRRLNPFRRGRARARSAESGKPGEQGRPGFLKRTGRFLKRNWEKVAIGGLVAKAFGPQLLTGAKAVGGGLAWAGKGLLGLGAKGVGLVASGVGTVGGALGAAGGAALVGGVFAGAIVEKKLGITDRAGRRLAKSRFRPVAAVGRWLQRGYYDKRAPGGEPGGKAFEADVGKMEKLLKEGGVVETKLSDGSSVLYRRGAGSEKGEFWRIHHNKATKDRRGKTKAPAERLSFEQYKELRRDLRVKNEGFAKYAAAERAARGGLDQMGRGLEPDTGARSEQRRQIEQRKEMLALPAPKAETTARETDTARQTDTTPRQLSLFDERSPTETARETTTTQEPAPQAIALFGGSSASETENRAQPMAKETSKPRSLSSLTNAQLREMNIRVDYANGKRELAPMKGFSAEKAMGKAKRFGANLSLPQAQLLARGDRVVQQYKLERKPRTLGAKDRSIQHEIFGVPYSQSLLYEAGVFVGQANGKTQFRKTSRWNPEKAKDLGMTDAAIRYIAQQKVFNPGW